MFEIFQIKKLNQMLITPPPPTWGPTIKVQPESGQTKEQKK